MGLTKRESGNRIYLEVKFYSLWRGIKKKVAGCEEIETTNPKTGAKVVKWGYSFNDVKGRVTKLEKYDTGTQYATRYFGFKLHMVDGPETFVLDMPYKSQILKRFLRLAHNIDWAKPLSITVFKGKKKDGDRKGNSEETGVWFRQDDVTVPTYYTKDAPHGMPIAKQDPNTLEWDFRAQQSWLVDKLKTETIPAIEAAARLVAPPIEPDEGGEPPEHSDADEDPFGDSMMDDEQSEGAAW